MTAQDFLNRVDEVFAKRGWHKSMSPAALLHTWKEFVDLCDEGYPGTIYEYDDEIRVREWIEVILSSPELAEFGEVVEYRAYVEEIDNRFRQLQLPGVKLAGRLYWWEELVLRTPGPELAKDIKDRYGIE